MRGGEVVEYENDILLFGMTDEVSLVELDTMGEFTENIVEYLHIVCYTELLSRAIESMWDWEVRTKHMFETNRLRTIRDIVQLEMGKVNRLVGCGYKTRKEVYDVFCVYHLRLKNWTPELHWEKMNYKFN